jgi:signal transduction histidine kinase
MNDPAYHYALEDIQFALKELSKQTLPVQTRSIIQTAQTRLDQLSRTSGVKTQENHLAALNRVSQNLGLSLSQSEVLNQAMDSIIQLTGAERGFLSLIDPTTGDLQLQAIHNIEPPNLPNEDMGISQAIIQFVIDTDEGIFTSNAQTDPRFAGQLSVVPHLIKPILCVPLRSNRKIIGVIYVENCSQSGVFTSEDLDLVTAFASQAAIAIDNVRLYTRTNRALTARIRELEILSQIDQELNAELDLAHIIEISRIWAIKSTDAVQCWIGLADDETGSWQFTGPENGENKAPGSEVFYAISKNNTPQTISDGQTRFLAIPLIHADELLGAIVVTGENELRLEEQQFLTRIAGRVSAAITNARLFQAVQRANESRSQFVSFVTHELRIPLTSIKGYTDLIRHGAAGQVNDQQLSFLEVIRSNTERMASLISDLADISRIEHGVLHLELSQLDIPTYIDETIRRLHRPVEEKNQTITIRIPRNLPHVLADPNRLVQVLNNLLSNAWKYTQKGGNIIVSTKQTGDFVRVEIIDNGVGISEADQEKLFSQFFRSEAPEIREQTGWGLSLNVTQKLIEIMGGEIGFSSTLNQGSTFWFALPVAQNSDPQLK